MNSQDIRNLQEAYMEVVENQQLDEISKRTLGSYVGKVANANYSKDPRDAKTSPRTKGVKLAMDKISGSRRVKVKATNEQISIYDIILSHLLDEGYAETPEAAEAIIVNMSEEWRESIVEQQVPIHPAEDAFNRSTPEERAANMKKYNTPYKPLDTSRSTGSASAPAWMRGGFKSQDEYNRLDPKTKAMLD